MKDISLSMVKQRVRFAFLLVALLIIVFTSVVIKSCNSFYRSLQQMNATGRNKICLFFFLLNSYIHKKFQIHTTPPFMSLPNVNIVLAPGRSSVTSHKSFDYQRKSSVPVPLKRPAVGSEPAFQTFQSISEFVQHAVERRKKGVHSMPSTSIEQNQSIDIVLQAHGESASDIGRATGRTSLENGRHQSSQELKPIDQDREVSTSYSESLDQIFQASAVAAQEYSTYLLICWLVNLLSRKSVEYVSGRVCK